MSSTLALFLCTVFVLFMLRLDRKQSSKVSLASWVPSIWMLLTASKPLAFWFHAGGRTNEEGSQLDQIALVALLGLGLIILANRKFKWSSLIKENKWVLLLVVYMLVSCLWSDIPFISFRRWSRELIAVIMAFIIATEPDPRDALESLFRRLIYILIPFSYFLINYSAEHGRVYVHSAGVLMWVGVTLHKNQLGQLCLFAAFFLTWTFIKRWRGRDTSAVRYQSLFEALILFMTFWIISGPNHSFTYSATSTASFAAGLFALVGFSRKSERGINLRSRALIALIALLIIYGTVTPIVGKLTLVDISSLLGRSQTLTGRTSVWAELVPVVMSHPILGCGYGGFWTTMNRDLYDISGAHNGYLAVILELGFVGLILFSMFILSSCWKAAKEMNNDYDWACFKICFFLMMVLHNIAESTLDTFTFRMTAITLLLAVSSTITTSSTLGGPRKL